MLRRLIWMIFSLTAALMAPPAHAADFGTGAIPIASEPATPIALVPSQKLRIEGSIDGTVPVTVVLRIDDTASTDYASRMNDERTLKPGPFSLSFDTSALRATNGRTLDISSITRVIFFINGDGAGTVSRFDAPTTDKPTPTTPPAITASRPAPVNATSNTVTTFGTGTLPVAFEPPAPVAIETGKQIRIDGTVTGTTPATIVLRVDDTASTDYASRMNHERIVQPGPFSLKFDTATLRAINGRVLDISKITRVIFFINGAGAGTVSRFDIAANDGSAPATTSASNAPTPSPSATGPANFGSGAFPVAFEPPGPVALPAGQTIRIDGIITGTASAKVVLRVDDATSTNYASRMNDERILAPGPFSLRFETSKLQATNGRVLDINAITRIIAFIDGPGSGGIARFDVASKTDTTPPPPMPDLTPPPPPPPGKTAPRTFPTGGLPQSYETTAPIAFNDDDEIRLEGTVNGKNPAAVAIRIDDTSSASYATRYNDERTLPPGPFKLTIRLKGLKTPSRRIIDHRNITKLFVFIWKDSANVVLTSFKVEQGQSLPKGTVGYSLGADDAALPPSFVRIGPGDPRLEARGAITVVRRPAPDAIVANGLNGIKSLKLEAPEGRARVTLWTEDPGEWEELPRELDRTITVNGVEALSIKQSAEQWISSRYLRSRNTEHSARDDAWTAYGSKRGGRRHADVTIGKDGVTIALSGTNPASYFLSAVLIEPIPATTVTGDTPGQTVVDAQRAEWYRSTFPVITQSSIATDKGVPFQLDWTAKNGNRPPDANLTATPGTGVRLKLDTTTDVPIANPRIEVVAPKNAAGKTTTAEIWAATWRLERDLTVLRRTDNFLRTDTATLPLTPVQPRSYEVWIDVPADAASGTYKGAVIIAHEKQRRSITINLTVVPVKLPPATKPAGFYLARAPHLTYFNGLAIETDKQITCDLTTLRRFGLTNSAPPVSGIDRADLAKFGIDMRRAAAEGVADGWLIYNPLHSLLENNGPERAAEIVSRLEAVTRKSALPQPLWSIADEPSNPDQSPEGLANWSKALRAKAPNARLGGHLNTPADEKYLALFDTAIINPGFGIDTDNLIRLKKSGKDLWFYNTFVPRLTAGGWLWNTPASHYVQWHARMPTADPFDPIDGRESDYQVLYPMRENCAKTPDIHRDLLRMAEGVVDQRWLLWLESQSSPEARALTSELRRRFSGKFTDAANMTSSDLGEIRNKIIAVVH